MITVVTAPTKMRFPELATKIFLAGGIQKCDEWQQKIINMFKTNNVKENIYLINPRRENFPIDDPNAAEEQITWEFEMLEQCDMFTMLFLDSESDQPICFYELGRNLERMKQKFPQSWEKRIVITSDSNFKRVQDVVIQTKLSTGGKVDVSTPSGEDVVKTHFENIIKKL